jgi:hypothetical protein
MALLRLSDSIFIRTDVIAFIAFNRTETSLEADLVFTGGGNRTFRGGAAEKLYDNLNVPSPVADAEDAGLRTSDQPNPNIAQPDSFVVNLPAPKKAWFLRRDPGGRALILAFVNREQSCTVRTFDAKSGKFIAKLAGVGSYRDCFADLVSTSIELSVPFQPNLDRSCKERLPEPILMRLHQQIETLDVACWHELSA